MSDAFDAASLRRTADDYLEWCFAHGTVPRVSELAERLRLQPARFSNLFARHVGERPHVYLQRGQVERAKQLLLLTELPMKAIAAAACFGTEVTFFRVFREGIGMTPQHFREQHRRSV